MATKKLLKIITLVLISYSKVYVESLNKKALNFFTDGVQHFVKKNKHKYKINTF